MRRINVKKAVKEFRKKYDIHKAELRQVQNAIEAQGFTIIEYSQIRNPEDVQVLIDDLKLDGQILSCKSFVYQDDMHRLVFVNERLNEEERLIVMCHEAGHIWLNHMQQQQAVMDVMHEYEANEFAHYLLQTESNHKKVIGIAAIAVAIVIVLVGIVAKGQHDSRIYQDNYYRTATGNKYHIEKCVYIRNRTDTQRLTKEEFESGEFEACSVCLP